MRQLSTLIMLLGLIGMFGGCPATIPADTDNTADTARRVPPDLQVKDSLDVKKKDVEDWKSLTALDEGTGKLKVHFGDFDGNHDLVGEIEVYSKSDRESLAKRAVSPGEGSYELEFPVDEGEDYFVKVAATKGKADYAVSFEVEKAAPKDPCEDVECEDNEECEAGKCIEVEEAVCEPACGRGRVCVDGTCERPCGGACPTGQVCSRRKNVCVTDPCYRKKCGSNQTCRYGRCRDNSPPPKVGCDPACGSGFKCSGTTCVKVAGDEPPDTSGPVRGKVIQLIPQGKKTVLVLNRGSKVGVKAGATGRISGVNGSFKITEVYTFRAKAIIGVDEKTIGSHRSFTID